MYKRTVLHSSISIGSRIEFIDAVFNLVRYKLPSYVCFANVHMVMDGYRDPAFQDVINHANLVAPDGKPISVFLNHFENTKQERICGMDLLPELLKKAEALGRSVYFYGTTDELLKVIVRKAKLEFPNLTISGYFSPPFRPLTEKESIDINEQIKASAPDLVFVSLGCPKQEKWMAENRNKIGSCLLGVGQAFNVYANVEKRLPKWMRNLCLEWTYRLWNEPRRLFKRYFFTNFHFLFLTFILLANQAIYRLSAHLVGRPVHQVFPIESDE